MLTVHSQFRIENHTNHELEFNVHLFMDPSARDARGSLLHNAAISTVPASPLQPGAQCYLPVPAVWYALLPAAFVTSELLGPTACLLLLWGFWILALLEAQAEQSLRECVFPIGAG